MSAVSPRSNPQISTYVTDDEIVLSQQQKREMNDCLLIPIFAIGAVLLGTRSIDAMYATAAVTIPPAISLMGEIKYSIPDLNNKLLRPGMPKWQRLAVKLAGIAIVLLTFFYVDRINSKEYPGLNFSFTLLGTAIGCLLTLAPSLKDSCVKSNQIVIEQA